MSLSILCVTRGQQFAEPFLCDFVRLGDTLGAEVVFCADGEQAERNVKAIPRVACSDALITRVNSLGYLESVLEQAVNFCASDYILRFDDDERCSNAMMEWLLDRRYESAPHWKFATANMWQDEAHFITNPPLWPDHHTRLSVKAMSGGRHYPHSGSPFGGGDLAPVIFEHHKFLVKTYEERKAVAARYDAFSPGYGTGDNMRPFSLPEDSYSQLVLAQVDAGTLIGCEIAQRFEVRIAA